jgi:HEAT repeat protein
MRAVLIFFAFSLFNPSAIAQNPKPNYKGKPLVYWVERLQKAETDKDQVAAADAIKAFGPDAASAVPTLIEMLLNDRSGEFRWFVSLILCDISHTAKGTVPELVKRLKELQARKAGEEKESENTSDMSILIRLLGSIGPDAKDAVPVLIVALDHPELREETVRSLCEIGPGAKDAIPALRRLVLDLIVDLEKKQEPVGRSLEAFSCYDLHKLGPDVLPLLLELIDLPGVLGKRIALREFYIEELGPAAKKAAPKLAPLLQDKDPQIRYWTADVLWNIEKNTAVVPVLVGLLNVNEPFLDRWAATLLGEIGSDAKEALPALKLALEKKWASYEWIRRYGSKLIPLSEYAAYMTYEAVKEAIQKIEPSSMK